MHNVSLICVITREDRHHVNFVACYVRRSAGVCVPTGLLRN